MADLIRAAGPDFIERSHRWLTSRHRKVLTAIERCRTSALGGHVDECSRCGHRAISYNSCRNRHCPKCQGNARERWLADRQQELLPTRYAHVVFTLPHLLAPLALQNKKIIYGLLFRASAETLLEIARDPKHLGADIGFFSVLHTGGLSPDHTGWIKPRYPFFLPVKALPTPHASDGLRPGPAFWSSRLILLRHCASSRCMSDLTICDKPAKSKRRRRSRAFKTAAGSGHE